MHPCPHVQLLRQSGSLNEQHLARMNAIKEQLKSHLHYFLTATNESSELKQRARECKKLLKEFGSTYYTVSQWPKLCQQSKIGAVIFKFANRLDDERHPSLRTPQMLAKVLVMMMNARFGCQGRVLKALQEYRERKEELERMNQSKPDMQAYKELRAKYSWLCERRPGLNDEVPVGLVVNGRGEAAFLGIHSSILSGIDSIKGYPAYAVCLAGKYDDEESSDGTIVYTGAGGQDKKGNQAEDQQENSGNVSLLQAEEEKTPIRVLRKIGDKKGCTYRYEGLYLCTQSSYEASGRNPKKVFKFILTPIDEQSTRYFKNFAPKQPRKG
mmetsp:Transcript_12841/g.24389  ORF Transcript_12841/g.24389 Transcript_12841/m.24389 type:complete len:326 (+) Transcript_12841:90-1067(+)|eukprot:scaffold2558_cov172-Amphora_coffeaeformis.AAC.9